MLGYCTAADVRLALAPVAQDPHNQTATSLTDAQINDAIAEAEGTINAYILARYKVVLVEFVEADPDTPGNTIQFTVAPEPIRGWTRSFAAYLANLSWRIGKDVGEDDPIRLRYEYVKQCLVDVRDRKMDLTLPPAGGDTDTQGITVVNLYEGRLFSLSDVGLGYEGDEIAQRFISGRTF